MDGVDSGGDPIIQLERYEEAIPGLHPETWLGVWQALTLEGQEVLLLTTEDGKQYVLSGSLQYGKNSAIGHEGDRVAIQGLAEPGKSFGGYPVITELSGSIVQPGEVVNFPDQSISVYDERGARADYGCSGGAARCGNQNQVELAYAAASLQQCGCIEHVNDPAQAPWLYVQPIWRFTGAFEDGRPFEVQVQALRDEFLSYP